MNVPINCPICNDPLLNEFLMGSTMLKSCQKRLNHSLIYGINEMYNTVKWIRLEKAIPDAGIIWFLDDFKKRLAIDTGEGAMHSMPFFEPNFSDYPKLLTKLKTYIILS